MDVRVFLATLLLGVASGASVYSRSPYWMGYGGGVTLTITGSGFSEDQFNQFDPTLGNTVKLVNEADTIDCEVIKYLTNTNKIVCSTGRKTNKAAPDVYTIKVFVDGQEASSSSTVQFATWVAPIVKKITPRMSLPGALVHFYASIRTARYKVLDVSNPTTEDPNVGYVLTQVYVGNVDCEMINSTTDKMYGSFTSSSLTCLVTSKNIGPMNGTVYVTERGASVTDKWGVYVDSKDRLYQHHTYAGVKSVSPSTGSTGGNALITVTGVGFNPFPGSTEVRVGGAVCELKEVTDDTITCLTPAEDQTSPGSRERGLLWEFWEGEYPDISNDDQWFALNSSHPSYSNRVILDADFYVEISSNSAGKLSGYLHPAHDGEYKLTLSAGSAWTRIYVATNGNPDNLTFVEHLEMFSMTQATPTYFEIRFRGTTSTTFKIYMGDYNAKFTYAQSIMARDERQRVRLYPEVTWDTHRLTPSGTPGDAKLYLNGMTSGAIDVTDVEQVRSAVLELVERRCSYVDSGSAQYTQQSGYEDGDATPDNSIGNIVNDIEPYCGRKALLTQGTDSRLYYQPSPSYMVDLKVYNYVCFAIQGNIVNDMRVIVRYLNNRFSWGYHHLWFNHNIVVDSNTWRYQCFDVKMILDSDDYLSNYREDDAPVFVYMVFAPNRASAFDKVYVDEFTFSDENIDVRMVRPSALHSQGIMIEEVNVSPVEHDGVTSLDVEFVTLKCFGHYPLLGVTEGSGDPSWLTTLDSSATSATFSVTGGDINVTRLITATTPVEGTWSMNIMGENITGISPRVEAADLQKMIESALGVSGISVSSNGKCNDRSLKIEWSEDPGRKPLTTVDASQLTFDGESLSLTVAREVEGRVWHDGIMSDYFTVRRTEPHVSVRVNDYSSVCLGDCSYGYDDADSPVLSSAVGSIGDSGEHTVTIIGSGFTSSDVSDYAVSVNSAECVVTAVTSTEITCTVAHLPAGNHAISVAMQPVGAALHPDPAVVYTVALAVTSITPSTGGTGGGYSVVVTGSGFPVDLSGWSGNTVTVGGANCDVTDADSASVTCTLPAGSDGSVDVSVTVSGETDTMANGFTYDSSLSPSISSDTQQSTTYSVLGGEELTITGSGFGDGTDSYVMVGEAECDIQTWDDMTITCLLPPNDPGVYDLLVYIGGTGYASGTITVTYTLKVTGSSSTTGSVYGGTILVLDGEGFGTDCSLLEVTVGESIVCDVTECSDAQITCVTRLVSTNHVITNMGTYESYGVGFAWTPKPLRIREGDSVTWAWSKKDPFSQLLHNVFQTPSATDNTYDGAGFHSGSPVSAGAMVLTFPNAGTFYYASDPILETFIMSGQVDVVRPSEEVSKISVTLGGIEAEYEPSGASSSATVDGCSSLLETPFDGCSSTAPSAPDSDNFYFITDLCLTPTVTAVSASATESISGLTGTLVRTGVTLTISGSGFGTDVCQTSVMVGPASCTVTASDDTSVTCVLDDADNVVSMKAFPVVVTVANRGTACVSVSDFINEGQVTVIPVMTSFTPVEGSEGGGTLITISGSGLNSYDDQALVTLGSGTYCTIESLSATAITCSTQAAAASTVTLTVFVTAFNIPAVNDMPDPSYTFRADATPSVTDISNSLGTITLTGTLFGTDASAVTVTLTSYLPARHKRNIDEEQVVPLDPHKEEDKEEVKILIEDVEELYEDNMYANKEDDFEEVIYEEARRSTYRPKIRSDLFDQFDAESDFWGVFTNTQAKSFEESLRLGAWRIAGSKPKGPMETEVREEKQQVLRQEMVTSYDCVISSIDATTIVCDATSVPAGSYVITVNIASLGDAVFEVSPVVEMAATISSITPTEGSIHGGALLTISGAGFTPGEVSVALDGTDCPLESEVTDSLTCRVPAHAAGVVDVIVTSAGIPTSSADFTYDVAKTPVLTSVTPDTGISSGTSLTLSGTGLKISGTDPLVTVGGVDCPVSAASDTSVTCASPDVAGGPQAVVLTEAVYGDSNSDITVSYDFTISAVTPDQGGYGGAEVVITGFGFEPAGDSTVTICGNPCSISSGTSTEITCVAPSITGTDSTVPCDVVVTNLDSTLTTLADGFTYVLALTPAVTLVSPKRGGTAGGTVVTITGTGFAASGNTVTIGGSDCIVSAESVTEITCETEPHAGPGTFPVLIDVPAAGYATTDENGEFFYIDRWSSIYTWGGEAPPSAEQLVVIPEGQTVLLDDSTDVLKAIILKGGHLIFDDDASSELVLRAEYILIVEGGSLSIGSEEEPFMNKAVIELHGNTRSIELPHYGAKVLAVRNGTLDLHGAPVPVTWTHLASTANPGDMSITLTTPVTWQTGDQIIIATTEHRFSKNENEERTIDTVSSDGLTVTLTEALEFEHISIVQTLGGQVIETRAEVGLLTHNVKVRGNINEDFSKVIEACDETWHPGQFKVQSCFNGRFGEEIGSDMFGATVMLFGKEPDKDLVHGRIEYVEVTEAGQAFQLGRYPIHFHLVGNVNTSYVRGCGIHRTYNRAVTIHAANYLTLERNVIYNNMGHAIFTEDGVEEYNVIQYNLAVFTRSSSSLLNVDITPSSYWVVHPNNIVRHNAAAGGTHFGYWYRMESHPSGPSATTSVCPNFAPMGEFFNNTAHSFGWYGLWVFSMAGYYPKDNGCWGNDVVATFNHFTVWKCERGAEAVTGGNLQFHNFVALDNELAGIEMVEMSGGVGEDDGPGVFNSLVIGHSALGNGTCGDEASGVVAARRHLFSISGTKFINFDTGRCSALSGCSQCHDKQGGYRVQVKGLSFENAPNKLRFRWEHESIWIDADGSLSGTPENNVVPSMGILPPANCQMDVAEFSANPGAPGAVCGGLKFLRFNLEGDDIEPSSLVGNDLIVSNSHGNTSVPYKNIRLDGEGWMGILPAEETYMMEFDYSSQITNITYEMETLFLEPDDYYYVQHQLMQRPDFFSTTHDMRNSTDGIPDPIVNYHGDYHWDNDTQIVTYMVSGKTKPDRTIFDDRPLGSEQEIYFQVYRCYFTNCIQPTPPPVPTGRPDATYRWSDTETWKDVPVGSGGHPTEETYGLPVEGDEVIIPPGMWLIVDIATPKLGRVYVYGTIEFEDVMDHTFEATIIYIQGGTVVAGFSESFPFAHNLNIILRGSLDPEDPDNVDMPMPFGVPNVGWKAIAVFGQLTLHGQHSGSAWVKLGATAAAGDSVITLAEPADSSWANKEVMITTTSKEASETEIRTVVSVSGSTLTLDSALEFEHLSESFTLSDNSASFTMAAEVGILSRNIVIEGNDYEDLQEDSFGGRIIVSQLNSEGVDYVGQAQLHSVELKNMGQEGFTDTDDPRYSLAFFNLGTNDGSNYVKKCSFNKNYNTAIGFFSASNITVEDNVIYHTVGACIRDHSSDNSFKGNLLSVMLFPGTYNGRWETQNVHWDGAFALNKATDVILENNVVAGSEQAGYQTYGELCEDATLFQNNEVHGAIFGVLLWKTSGGWVAMECRRLNDFYAWRVWDTAFYMQDYSNLLLTDVKAVDCRVGVNQIIYSPFALSHQFLDKAATTENSFFVGASPYHTCDYHNSQVTIGNFYHEVLWMGGVDSGNSGIVFASFVSNSNMAPRHSFGNPDSYPALHGATNVSGVTFANYGTRGCGTDVALITNVDGNDGTHPIFTSGLTFVDTPSDNYIFMNEPNLERVNPADCVDMDCDGHKKVVIRDMDGTLLGSVDATAIAMAEYEWDGLASHGVGDYRIPVPLRQNIDGSEITAAEKFPNKGIVRDGSCTHEAAWRAWKCTGLKHRMMVIESMDSDTEIRRLSPIALIANPGTNGYVDLLNGPMDRGWCEGYTCQERISTFYSIVAADYIYEMAMTSSPPQVIRFHLLHSDESESVVLRIFYPMTQRYDVYVDNIYIPPTNIDEDADSYQLIPPDDNDPEAFFPTLSDTVGTNYLQRDEKFLHVLLRGGRIIDIKTTPMIILTTGVVIDPDEFFEENVVGNVAAMLGVSTENIRVTNIIREGTHRRRRMRAATEIATFTFDIASSPTASLDGGDAVTSGDVLSYEDLEDRLSSMIDKFQTGSCDECNITLASVEVVDPLPPPEEAGEPATAEFGQVVIEGGELYSNVQQKEESINLNKSLEATLYEEPGVSFVDQGVPTDVVAFTPFATQPSITVQSTDGDAISSLGYISDPWMIEAVLSGGPAGALLLGTNPVPYVDGAANFTDLSVNSPGEGYSLSFHVAYPDTAPPLPSNLGYTFDAGQKSVSLAIMSTPEFVNANTDFDVQLAVIDDDTGNPIDPSQLMGQTLTGKIRLTNTKKKGELLGLIRFTFSGDAASDFTLSGLSITKPGPNFKYEVKINVSPAGWKSKVHSEGFNVLPEDLVIPEDAITKAISMKGFKGKPKKVLGKTKLFAIKLLKALVLKVGEAYWHDVTVQIEKRPFAQLSVTGSPTQVQDAIEKLCDVMKTKLKVKIRRQKFIMAALRVDGELMPQCKH